ncbi:aldehyde dehydrogenase (NADP(+)) [Puia dinghuensis]|uniref:2,5-dioxovalerate dehydrogenase n=1 Tax=Puia dinghuensis TaxID=1792502 RepID=A0A8J2U714_9BACT|nr:aldehyde dehydrogenase (NADP(+)) [Puia dinghuensis]GGA83288.1 2,5-dioxovalerate dehydrogenase [Puia dinghuensis]
MTFPDTSPAEINRLMQEAWQAFPLFRNTTLKQRADLMRAIAHALEAAGDELIHIAMQETNLPEARLRNERARTMFQLTSYAEACEAGHWLEARIDTANAEKGDVDVRKLQVAIGPVVVFGASNFPFAYSTAGGDTASALAAGCPVIVKAHPAHAETSERVAQAIVSAVAAAGLPAGVFAHVHGAGFETGKALVTHPYTRAVGFTGSYGGGKALFDWANQRKVPIPVFAEMGSINPVFLLPDKLEISAKELAAQLAGSITLGTGQFCTNPGLILGIEGEGLDLFIKELGAAIEKAAPGTMLHPGIAKAYGEKRSAALGQSDVATIAVSAARPGENQGVPTIASATAEAFFNNPLLHQEVFGPYSLVIRCRNAEELVKAAMLLEGQLTTSLMATEEDIAQFPALVDAVQDICGRLILNGVPTGVRVSLAMQHGGPFPATTDSRFTSVGADGIKRWVRPLAYQSWLDAALPDALKNSNPLGIWRMVNNLLTRDGI